MTGLELDYISCQIYGGPFEKQTFQCRTGTWHKNFFLKNYNWYLQHCKHTHDNVSIQIHPKYTSWAPGNDILGNRSSFPCSATSCDQLVSCQIWGAKNPSACQMILFDKKQQKKKKKKKDFLVTAQDWGGILENKSLGYLTRSFSLIPSNQIVNIMLWKVGEIGEGFIEKAYIIGCQFLTISTLVVFFPTQKSPFGSHNTVASSNYVSAWQCAALIFQFRDHG